MSTLSAYSIDASMLVRGVIVCLVSAYLARRFAISIGHTDQPCDRKQHDGAIPLIGGIALYLALVVVILVDFRITNNLAWLIGSATLVFLVGLKDDHSGASAWLRLISQCIASGLMIFGSGMALRGLGDLAMLGPITLNGGLSVFLTILAVVSLTNAFNMIDGTDGLAISMALVAITGLIVFQFGSATIRHLNLLLLTAMALIPLLVMNLSSKHHTKIFLGDAGSLLLGYLIAWIAISLATPAGDAGMIRPVDALWCVALPLMDKLTVMYLRWREGLSPFRADRRHIHHLFQSFGHSPIITLLAITTLAVAMLLIGFVLRQVPEYVSMAVYLLSFLAYVHLVKSMNHKLRTDSPLSSASAEADGTKLLAKNEVAR